MDIPSNAAPAPPAPPPAAMIRSDHSFSATPLALEAFLKEEQALSEEPSAFLPKPKRQLTAYNFFFQLERQRLLADLPPKGNNKAIQKTPRKYRKPAHNKIGFAALGREIAARWKKLSKAEKAYYKDLSRHDKVRYDSEMTVWNKKEEERIMRRFSMHQQQQGGDEEASTAPGQQNKQLEDLQENTQFAEESAPGRETISQDALQCPFPPATVFSRKPHHCVANSNADAAPSCCGGEVTTYFNCLPASCSMLHENRCLTQTVPRSLALLQNPFAMAAGIESSASTTRPATILNLARQPPSSAGHMSHQPRNQVLCMDDKTDNIPLSALLRRAEETSAPSCGVSLASSSSVSSLPTPPMTSQPWNNDRVAVVTQEEKGTEEKDPKLGSICHIGKMDCSVVKPVRYETHLLNEPMLQDLSQEMGEECVELFLDMFGE